MSRLVSAEGHDAVDLDAVSVCRVLTSHGVEFVVIGGVAAQALNLPVPATIDIDITPSRREANLILLAAAFDELEAGLNTADAGGTWFPRVPVERWASYDTLHLITKHGPVDVVFAPDGAPTGHAQLVASSVVVELGGVEVRVIDAPTWEMLKHAAGREKDLEHLERYYEGGGSTSGAMT